MRLENNILEVNNLTKRFRAPVSLGRLARLDFHRGEPVTALDGVSFALERGRVLCVLGPNGAGKTTLLKVLSTLILPDSGTAVIDGHSLPTNEDTVKSLVGLVTSPERTFYWRLTGMQNLEFFAALYGLSPAKARSKIGELFRMFEIEYEDRRFDSYSAGMKQKFAIIRSLLNDPALLLLDEPIASLDYATAVSLRKFIKERLVLKEGRSAILTTHRMDEAADFGGPYMVLHKGRTAAFGALDELSKKAGLSPSGSLGDIFLALTKEDKA